MFYNINLLKLTCCKCPLVVYCFAVCLQVGSDPEPLAWSFNLSHQGDYAVLAAERGVQVGVDIMKTTMPGSMLLYYLILLILKPEKDLTRFHLTLMISHNCLFLI